MINLTQYSVAPFKEPRGLLKLLQWLFAICAFATTANFATDVGFTTDVKCGTVDVPLTVKTPVSYPFGFDKQELTYNTKDLPGCPTESTLFKVTVSSKIESSARSDSQFFVATGVICFLYTTVLIGIHLYADHKYMDSANGVTIDFMLSVFIALFWLSGTAAWWKGITELRWEASADNWTIDFEPSSIHTAALKSIIKGSYGGLTISVLFGFINFILWATNLWFLYKETPWYESIVKRSAPTTVGSSSPTSLA